MKINVQCLISLLACLSLYACDSESSSGGGGAAGMEEDGGREINTDAAMNDGAAGEDTGMGGMGGMGGEGGMMGGMEQPIEERCPDAQAGTYLLVVFPDRVDAYRQREFGASFFCKFLDLAGNGISNATGLAINRDNDTIYVVQPEEGKGGVYAFNVNGSFERKVTANVNLDGVDGIWNSFGNDYVVWSRANQNLYRLNEEGRFAGIYSPPVERGSLFPNVTDMVFLDQDSLLMTYGDRSPKLFKAPFAPDFPEDEIGPANAVVGVETEEGIKILMTAQIGGEGNAYGVALYKAAESGRVAPERESIIIAGGDGDFVDGIDLLPLDTGLLILDSDLAGTAKITSFNAQGELQNTIPLQGEGSPSMFTKVRIFPDF